MTNDEPLVSVVVPVYNTERYLARCLDSILVQSLENIEVLVVDDCSPDGSATIIRRYEAADGRLAAIRHTENLGLGGARNTGIAAARGRYIASVDSDDALTPAALETAVGRCERDGTEIGVFSSLDYIEDEGKTRVNPFYDLEDLPRVLQVDASTIADLVPTFQLKLYARALIARHGVRFPEHLYHEDDEFYWKLFGCALPRVSVIPQRLYLRTRRSDESSIMDNATTARKDMPRVLHNAMRFLVERDAFARIRGPFVYKVCRTLYVTTFVREAYRREVFEGMRELLNHLRPTPQEVANPAWAEEIRAIRERDYTGYLNWKIDRLQQGTAKVQRDPSLTTLAELEDVYASTSWKLTAPLRWIGSRSRPRRRQ